MSQPDPDTRPDHPNAISARTTPTWEIELLASGALVFSLLQMPTMLDRWLLKLLPLLADAFRQPLILVFTYLRCALLALAVAFVVHLMLRVYWVALVGVHSVFPAGPRWDRMRQGPLMLGMLKTLWRPLPMQIERVDNASSLVFAGGVCLGLLMLSLAFGVGTLVMACGALGHWQVLGLSDQHWLLIGGAVLVLPMLLASMLDAMLRGRLSTNGRFARLLGRTLVMQRVFPGFAAASALLNTLSSNLVRRGAIVIGALVVCTAVVISTANMPQFRAKFAMRVLAPALASANFANNVNYRDQRRGLDRLLTTASLASLELDDAPLLLFVPLLNDRHPAALRRLCPDLKGRAADDPALTGGQAWLDCAAVAFAPQLDGQPLPEHTLIFAIDPVSGHEGLLWRIDNAAISSGRHLVTVNILRAEADAPGDEPAQPQQLLFFK